MLSKAWWNFYNYFQLFLVLCLSQAETSAYFRIDLNYNKKDEKIRLLSKKNYIFYQIWGVF